MCLFLCECVRACCVCVCVRVRACSLVRVRARCLSVLACVHANWMRGLVFVSSISPFRRHFSYRNEDKIGSVVRKYRNAARQSRHCEIGTNQTQHFENKAPVSVETETGSKENDEG